MSEFSATVTDISPLRVRSDEGGDELEVWTSLVAVEDLAVGDAVVADTLARRVLVVGKAGGVPGFELTPGVVQGAHLADGSVVAAKLAAAAVTRAAIVADAIDRSKIAQGEVTRALIEVGAVDGTRIADGAVTSPKIVAGSISGDRLAARTISADRIAAYSIGATEIAADSITGQQIAAGSITAADAVFATAAIGTAAIADGSITNAKIASLSADKIVAGIISADRVRGGTITAVSIASVSITGSTLTVAGSDGRLELAPSSYPGVSWYDVYGSLRGRAYYSLNDLVLGGGLTYWAVLGCNGEARVETDVGSYSFRPIRASAFNVSSRREVKSDIDDLGDTLDLVLATPVRSYDLVADLDDKGRRRRPRRAGLIADEAPEALVDGEGGDAGIDLYGMVSVLWRAVQQLAAERPQPNSKSK